MLTKSLSRIKLLLLVVLTLVLVTTRSKKPKQKIIIPTSPEISSSTPSPVPTPILTPSPTPKLIPTPTPSPSPQPSISPEEIHNLFERFSNKYNLDINRLRHVAVCESDFNPQASNLSYVGLFQFSPNTWTLYRNTMELDPNPDLRYNAEESIKTAAYLISIGKTYLWPNCIPD